MAARGTRGAWWGSRFGEEFSKHWWRRVKKIPKNNAIGCFSLHQIAGRMASEKILKLLQDIFTSYEVQVLPNKKITISVYCVSSSNQGGQGLFSYVCVHSLHWGCVICKNRPRILSIWTHYKRVQEGSKPAIILEFNAKMLGMDNLDNIDIWLQEGNCT